jgi:hypothetical protein
MTPGRFSDKESKMEFEVTEEEEKWIGKGVFGGKEGENVGRKVGKVEGREVGRSDGWDVGEEEGEKEGR